MYFTSLIGQWKRMTVKKQSSLISFMAFMKRPLFCVNFLVVKFEIQQTRYSKAIWILKRCNHQCQWHCSIVIISRSQDHAPWASLPSCSGSLDPCPTCQWEPGLQGKERSPKPERHKRRTDLAGEKKEQPAGFVFDALLYRTWAVGRHLVLFPIVITPADHLTFQWNF